MARKLGRPRGVDGLETRRYLLDVAFRQFATRGYAQTTMKGVAAAADVTPGAIYHYFASKAELYAATAREVVARMRELGLMNARSLGGLSNREKLRSEARAFSEGLDPDVHLFFMRMELEARQYDVVAQICDEVFRIADDTRNAIFNGDESAPLDLETDPFPILLDVLGLGLTRLLIRDREHGPARTALALRALDDLLGGPSES